MFTGGGGVARVRLRRRELSGAEGLVPGGDGAAGNQGAAAGDRARSIWKPWGGAAGMGGLRERRWLTRGENEEGEGGLGWCGGEHEEGMDLDPEEDTVGGGGSTGQSP